MGAFKEKFAGKKLIFILLAIIIIVMLAFVFKGVSNGTFFKNEESSGDNTKKSATGLTDVKAAISTVLIKGSNAGVDEFFS